MSKATESPDRPTPKLDEIEVTPEMVEAGARELSRRDLTGPYDADATATAVFLEMMSAKLRGL